MSADVCEKQSINATNQRELYKYLYVFYILTHFGTWRHLLCTLLHLLYDIRFVFFSQYYKIPLAYSKKSMQYDDTFFWQKMSAIFINNVCKHCLHACCFLRVWLNSAQLYLPWLNEIVSNISSWSCLLISMFLSFEVVGH